MILKHPGCYSGGIGYDCEKGGCSGGRQGHRGRGVATEAWQAPAAKVAPDAAKSPATEREGRWRRPRPCEEGVVVEIGATIAGGEAATVESGGSWWRWGREGDREEHEWGAASSWSWRCMREIRVSNVFI
jgi:hypothetical protein